MKNKTLTLLCLLLGCTVWAQQDNDLQMLEQKVRQLLQENQTEKALPIAQDLLNKTAQKTGKQDTTYAKSLKTLADVYSKMGDWDNEEPLLLECKTIWEKAAGKENPNYVKSIQRLGLFYKATGKLDQAENYFAESKDLCAKVYGKKSNEYASAVLEIALLYTKMVRREQAVPFYEEALMLKKELFGELSTECIKLYNLYGINHGYTDADKAEQLFMKAATLAEKLEGKQSPNYIQYIQNVCGVYIFFGKREKFAEVETLMLDILAAREKIYGKESSEYIMSAFNLGSFYLQIPDFDKAEQMIKGSIGVVEKMYGKKHGKYIERATQLTRVYLEKNNLEMAWRQCFDVVAAECNKDTISHIIDEAWRNEVVNSEHLSGYNLRVVFYVLQDLLDKDSIDSQKALKQKMLLSEAGLKMEENAKNAFIADADKTHSLEVINDWAHRYVNDAQKLADNSYLPKAFEIAEAGKSALLSSSIQTDKAQQFGDLPDTLAKKERDLQKRFSELKAQALSAKNDSIKMAAQSKLADVNIEINLFKKKIEQEYPRYNQIKYTKEIIAAKDIQAKLPAKTALLEYVETFGRVLIFYLDNKELALYAVDIPNDSLRNQIKNLRKALSDYVFIQNKPAEAHTLYTETAFWFYTNFIVNAVGGRDIEHLMIVPDGELGHLPFEAFLTEKASDQGSYSDMPYLLKKYKISYNYSAGLWKNAIENPLQRNNNGRFLGVAADYSVKASGNSRRAPSVQDLRNGLTELPAAIEEVKALQAAFDGTFVFGTDANERFFKEQAGQYQILHLAMHGILNKKSPILSSLAFTENGDSTQDNFLQAHEISNLRLNADLVVLSACETGYGNFQHGEGVMSLARAFMYAGTPSLVVSMWEVNDACTGIIMKHFYKYLSDGSDKAEALRQAKMQYLSEAKGLAAHPSYWAPFVQMGDSRPLQVGGKGGAWWWWVAGGGGVLVAALLLLRRKK